MEKIKLTNHEQEVMETLWLAGRPLPRNEIIERSPNRSWRVSTIHILLNGLLQKGAIQEAGFVKRNKTYGRLYAPVLAADDYYAYAVFANRDRDRIMLYVDGMLHSKAMSMKVYEQMEAIIQKWKDEHKDVMEKWEAERKGIQNKETENEDSEKKEVPES